MPTNTVIACDTEDIVNKSRINMMERTQFTLDNVLLHDIRQPIAILHSISLNKLIFDGKRWTTKKNARTICAHSIIG